MIELLDVAHNWTQPDCGITEAEITDGDEISDSDINDYEWAEALKKLAVSMVFCQLWSKMKQW